VCVRFTQALQRHVSCPEETVAGSTVGEALAAYFGVHARVAGYVLDERGTLRKHMSIFLDGRPVVDRVTLSDSLESIRTIDVYQALPGG
jgi:molybdopterin synthase sulfur carrier subunit